MAHPKSAKKRQEIRFNFDRRLRVKFKAETVSSDGGLLLYRELDGLSGHWIDRVHDCNRTPLKSLTLDMDSSFSPTYGKQEGTAFNKYYNGHGYHPLFMFTQFGHLECSRLRSGNVSSADGWESMLEPVINRYEHRNLKRLFRGDAGFTIPKLYETLEAAGFSYAIRLRKNSILNKRVASMLARPKGSSSNGVLCIYRSFEYQAGSWDKPRRVVVKLEWDEGEMFARSSFIVTNMKQNPKYITNFYNKRGTAEQYIKEGKHAINWTRLSCTSLRANEVRLKLHALAYNLAVFLKTCRLPTEVRTWSLTSIQNRIIKIGARIVRHAGTIMFQLAEVAVNEDLFHRILNAIHRMRAPPVHT